MQKLDELIQEAWEFTVDAWEAQAEAEKAEIRVWRNAPNVLESKGFLVAGAEYFLSLAREMNKQAKKRARLGNISDAQIAEIHAQAASNRAEEARRREKMADSWKGTCKEDWKVKTGNAADAWEDAADAWEDVAEAREAAA